MNVLELLFFIFELPYHLFHIVTRGKYAKNDEDKALYQTLAILLFVFAILGLFVFLLIWLIMKYR